MHKKNRRMSHHFPFPLPTWKTECGCGGSNLGPLRSGHSPRNGRASGQRSLPLWCHEASILTPWRLGLFMLGLLVQFSSVQLLSRVWLFATLWTTAHQASLSITNSWSLPKLMSIESAVLSNHLILCCPLLFQPSIFPSIRVFSDESVIRIRWPKYCSFSFSLSPSNEHSGLVSFRMDWLDLLAVQGTLKSLLQHHSLKASMLKCAQPSLWSRFHVRASLLEEPQLWLCVALS